MLRAVVVGIVCLALAQLLWCLSPGPEWLARRTALDYVRQYAPEYSHVEILKGETAVNFGPLAIPCPSWTVSVLREEGVYSPNVRLELGKGFFPTKVIRADWWASEESLLPDTPLPIPE